MKGYGTIAKTIAKRKAILNKKKFAFLLKGKFGSVVRRITKKEYPNIEMVSFSSSNDYLEQLLSILSFLRYVGTPKKWIIYSDGTHTKEHVDFLAQYLPFVELTKVDFSADDYMLKPELEPYRKDLIDYASSKFPLGKKLLFYLNHKICTNTIFLDSDILFYKKALDIHLLYEREGLFLPEWVWGTLDDTYKSNATEGIYQVNSGFIFIRKEVDPTPGLVYLRSLNNNYAYFTEQTSMHAILTAGNCWPLDPRLYYLNNSDQFKIGYNFNREQVAIRHYTSPVRHKMWQNDWKWQLSID